MRTVSISDIKTGVSLPKETYRIYLIRRDDLVLYIGKSIDAVTRLESHVNKGNWASFYGSTLDQWLTRSDEADTYLVDLYNENDITQYCKTRYPWFESMPFDYAVSHMEADLINEISPVFNCVHVNIQKHAINRAKWEIIHPRGIANDGVVLSD